MGDWKDILELLYNSDYSIVVPSDRLSVILHVVIMSQSCYFYKLATITYLSVSFILVLSLYNESLHSNKIQ
jgi:hypothetical protein